MQMTTSMFCANRCTFCWRGEKAPVSKTWYGPVDDSEFIIRESIKRHIDLLQGFGGNDKTNLKMYQQSKDVKHVALSLTGEPVSYPDINKILEEFHQRKISTFLVTNAQFPEQIEKIKNITQFYISVDAPNKVLLKEIDRPLFPDYYERLIKSLEIMREKKFRSCIRLTMIKNFNDQNLAGYKNLINIGKPDFIEVKGYMHVGASREFLERENMPLHEEVDDFTKKLINVLDDYEVVSDHKPSRVLCLIRKELNGNQYINFNRFFEIVNNGGVAGTADYSSQKMCPNQ
jgi:tRNA wybutosine-synthesizing protein 1